MSDLGPIYAMIPTRYRETQAWDLIDKLAGGRIPDLIGDVYANIGDGPFADCHLHHMWNHALNRAAVDWPVSEHYVSLLNDDIDIEPDTLIEMRRLLVEYPELVAVCANYDGRSDNGQGFEPVDQICAGRYDGTGGFGGFAFMLRGSDNFRFPNWLRWWYGDNYLLYMAWRFNRPVAIALNASVEIIDGGSLTINRDRAELEPTLADDKARWDAWIGGSFVPPAWGRLTDG